MGLVVGIGGTTRAGSATELALRLACETAANAGDEVRVFDGEYLAHLPFYRGPGWSRQSASDMVEAIRLADGLIIASPGYHGTISGVLKNALDYIEELAGDERVYLHDRPVGLIVTAHGHQAASSAMITLRTIVHSLRGWPTPFGAALKIEPGTFDAQGNCTDPDVRDQLAIVGSQVRAIFRHED
ncbi:NADPH-dependent FMN reductase [Qipengyuania oceanensis]|uniref:NADPH-dependent oxidoreductase n=1 Tax=Qipengyuania oceanensis TaxID=1463597 RepID=A0A844YEW9_9SPHN|nr:NAD(P)H-dependent oxidoreductase [Qipengyuania oceanensis]MXO62701.1 NADPH-dependent oxidoreductase [Qipengyuania oceanensis]